MWACERGVFVNAGPQNGEMYSPAVVLPFAFLLLFAWFLFFHRNRCYLCVFLFFCVFDAMCMVF